MAQGAAKNKGKGKVSGGRAKTGTMRKGRIAIAPKVTQKVREAAHKKQLSSKINDSIEKQMVAAASSGKLTIMKNKGDLEAGAGKDKSKGQGQGQGKGKGKA